MSVVGRYAPSPTGALHLGNLRTALAAYASARARGGRFLLRIEDLDGARCKREFEAHQLRDLEALGIEWDDVPLRQTERSDVYSEALNKLIDRRLAYPCFCSRKDIAAALAAPHGGTEGGTYPGTCSTLSTAEAAERIAAGRQHAFRLRVQQAPTVFIDGFQGEVAMDLARLGGDFVLRRADGFFAYQLACAVDDAMSGVTEVLRGDDLLESGQRQSYLLACLGLPVPRYAHIPLMNGPDGRRLAKRLCSEDLPGFVSRGYDATAVRSYLAHTLGVVDRGERASMAEIVAHWDLRKVPREAAVLSEETMASFR